MGRICKECEFKTCFDTLPEGRFILIGDKKHGFIYRTSDKPIKKCPIKNFTDEQKLEELRRELMKIGKMSTPGGNGA